MFRSWHFDSRDLDLGSWRWLRTGGFRRSVIGCPIFSNPLSPTLIKLLISWKTFSILVFPPFRYKMAFVGPLRQIHDHWSWTKSGKVQMREYNVWFRALTQNIFRWMCSQVPQPTCFMAVGKPECPLMFQQWYFQRDCNSSWVRLVRWNAAEPIYWFVCEVFFEFARFPKLLQFSRLKSLILGDIDSNVMFQTRIVSSSSSSSSLLIIIIKIIIAIILICGVVDMKIAFPSRGPDKTLFFHSTIKQGW